MSRILVIAIIFIALALRLINLNYNSPFNDEAIYVVIGTDGIYNNDWATLDAFTWMAGSPFAYPVVSAFLYKIGGLETVRFGNVVFGILTIYIAALTASLFRPKKEKKTTFLITLSLLAFMPISFYISRLATYDAPSFLFIFLGLYLLLKNFTDKPAKNEYYLLSAISIFMAFLVKYLSVIYLFFYILLAILYLTKNDPKLLMKTNWFYYFFVPVVLLFGFYGITNFNGLYTYITTVSAAEILSIGEKVQMLINEYVFVLPFWLVSLVYIFRKISKKTAFVFLLGAGTILVFHFAYAGAPSYDKHIFLSGTFIAMTIGIALPNMYSALKLAKKTKAFLKGNFIGFVAFLFIYLVSELPAINSRWLNIDKPLHFLADQVKKGDVILAESGDAMTLALYDKVRPKDVVTFDYIDYLGNETEEAYTQAVEDGYFAYIELEEHYVPKLERVVELNGLIMDVIDENYMQIYKEDGVLIYQRKF